MAPATTVLASPPAKEAGVPSRRQRHLRLRSFQMDRAGEIDTGKALGVAFVIVGAVVALLVAAQLLPTFIHAGANATSAITTTDFGDDTANSLRPVFGLLVALGVLISSVLLILAYVKLKND